MIYCGPLSNLRRFIYCSNLENFSIQSWLTFSHWLVSQLLSYPHFITYSLYEFSHFSTATEFKTFFGPCGWLTHSASIAANCTAELFSSHTINTFGNLGFDVLGIKKRIIKTLAVEYQLLLTLLSWEHYCPFKIVKVHKMGSTVTHVWTHLDMPCAFREHTIRITGCSRIPLI